MRQAHTQVFRRALVMETIRYQRTDGGRIQELALGRVLGTEVARDFHDGCISFRLVLAEPRTGRAAAPNDPRS